MRVVSNQGQIRWVACGLVGVLVCVAATWAVAADGDAKPGAVEVKVTPAEAPKGDAGKTDAEKKVAKEALPPLPADVVSRVNGQDITRKELADYLLKTYGDRGRSFLIRRAALGQAVDKAGITVTEKETEEARAKFLARLPVPPGTSREDRMKQFLERLAANGITEEEFMENILLDAKLDKLVAQQTKVDDKEVEQEFQKRYGPKLILRQILVAREQTIREIHTKLKAGEDFAALAKKHSTERVSADQGGKMRRPLAAGVRTDRFGEVAFSLTPNEISEPFQVVPKGQWCILKLDSIVPAQKIKFEDVEKSLRDDITTRKQLSLKPRLIDTIIKQAEIRLGNLVEPQEK